jgi:hypothetical protein
MSAKITQQELSPELREQIEIPTYTDQSVDPNHTGVKYKLVVVEGVPFLEVIES